MPAFERSSVQTSPGLAGSTERRMLLSVVVPCANEQEVLRETNRRLVSTLGQVSLDFEIIYVDDGSTDSTIDLLRELQVQDERIRVVRLSRNFGQQIAITAGLEHASGDAVVVIDADLQDPAELIPEFVERWLEGYDVVYGVRSQRDGETVFKRWTAKSFYRLINRLSDTAGSSPGGRHEISPLENASSRRGWHSFILDHAPPAGHVARFSVLRACRARNRVRSRLEDLCTRLGKGLDQYPDGRIVYWGRPARLLRHNRGIHWADLRRVERPTSLRGAGENRI